MKRCQYTTTTIIQRGKPTQKGRSTVQECPTTTTNTRVVYSTATWGCHGPFLTLFRQGFHSRSIGLLRGSRFFAPVSDGGRGKRAQNGKEEEELPGQRRRQQTTTTGNKLPLFPPVYAHILSSFSTREREPATAGGRGKQNASRLCSFFFCDRDGGRCHLCDARTDSERREKQQHATSLKCAVVSFSPNWSEGAVIRAVNAPFALCTERPERRRRKKRWWRRRKNFFPHSTYLACLKVADASSFLLSVPFRPTAFLPHSSPVGCCCCSVGGRRPFPYPYPTLPYSIQKVSLLGGRKE